MKISKKALSLLLAISMVFSIIPNSLVYAAEKSSNGNTYQKSNYDSDNNFDSGISDSGVQVTGITLNKISLTLENGESETLAATVTPADATDEKVFWSTSNSTVCTVDQNGKVTAEGNGSAVITVMTHDGGFTAKCNVNVITSITGITINKTNMTLTKGTQETLIAKVTPAGISYQDISWSSSNENICTVDSSGNVSALNVGTAIISATTKDSGYIAACLVTVIAPVTGVTLNKTELMLENGKFENLIATVSPIDATNKGVLWVSSNKAICTVDQNGKITAIGNGSATITVTTNDGNFSAKCSVSVNTHVTGITLNKTSMTIAKGSKETLIASVIPAGASQQAVSWFSSNETDCTVNSSGEVSALSVGTAVIFATTKDGGYTKACIITVVIPATGISLNKTELTLENGNSETLTATVTPSDATDQGISWSSSNNLVCTVDEDGKVTSINNGYAIITAMTSDGSFTVKCKVNVKTSVKGITLNKTQMTLSKGSSEALVATVTPAGASQKDILWFSSDETVCTVDSSGNVSSLNGGTAVVYATTKDGGYIAICIVTVTTPVTGITLNKPELTLENGKTEVLAATVNPLDATDQRIFWSSSNNSVCTVDEDGNVTALGNGSAVITVTTYDGSFSAKCNVNVITSVTGITLNKIKMILIKDFKGTLIATVSPAGASQQDVLWSSSDENVCTVDSTGNITALNVGTTEISAATKDGNYTAKCSVTVVIPVSDIALNKTELSLEKGKYESLSATTTPVDATNQEMFWASSNNAVCAVDQSGKVTAVGNGTAVITVMTLDGGLTAECSVTVFTSVTGVTLNKTNTTLVKGSKETLIATITPESASEKTVLWSTSDENVCTVDSSGNITAINSGSAVITVTTKDGNFTAKCTVTVVIPVTGITISPSALSIIKGNSEVLTATVSPNDATNKTVSWSSSNENVAVVDQLGKVTAVNVGTVTIAATTKDGSLTATTSVIVKPNTYIVTASAGLGGTVSGSGVYNFGSTVSLTAVPNEHYHFVSWTSPNGAVIGLDTTYTINNLNADTNAIANFATDMFTVTVNGSVGGTATGNGYYAYGSVINLFTTADNGYHFINWSDGNTTESRSYTVTGNATLTAYFKLNAYQWTYSITNNGTYPKGISSANVTGTYSAYTNITKVSSHDKLDDDESIRVNYTYTFSEPAYFKAGSSVLLTEVTSNLYYMNGGMEINGADVGIMYNYTQNSMAYYFKSDTMVNSITIYARSSTLTVSLTEKAYVRMEDGPVFMLNNTGTSENQNLETRYGIMIASSSTPVATPDAVSFNDVTSYDSTGSSFGVQFLKPMDIDYITFHADATESSIYTLTYYDIAAKDVYGNSYDCTSLNAPFGTNSNDMWVSMHDIGTLSSNNLSFDMNFDLNGTMERNNYSFANSSVITGAVDMSKVTLLQIKWGNHTGTKATITVHLKNGTSFNLNSTGVG